MREFRPLSVPTRAHPMVKRLFVEMNRQQIGLLDVAERAGVNKNTVSGWRTRAVPSLDNLQACLQVVGLELRITKGSRATDPEGSRGGA